MVRKGIDRKVGAVLGLAYQGLLLATLGTLFVFAPLKSGSRFPAQEPQQTAVAPVQEIPEAGKVLWLNPSRLRLGQGG
jgi:hypothetical protein